MKQNLKRSKRFGKYILIGFGFMFLLLAIAISIVWFGDTNAFFRKHISRLVYEKTNKIYHVNFDQISLNLIKKELRFTNLNFYPDSTACLDTSRNFVEFRTAELCISSIGISNYFQYKELTAAVFSLEKPTAKFTNGGEIDLGTFNNENILKGDSVKIPLFSRILFDTLRIKDAHVNIDSIIAMKMKGKIPVINFEAIGFQLGGIKTTDLSFPFDVADMFLKVEKVEQELPDSLHRLLAGELSFSLIHKTIQAKNVNIDPLDTTKSSNRNLYRIAIPEINLYSKQVESLLSSDTLSIQNLTLKRPSIQLKFGAKSGGGHTSERN
jgi:hypothetical protein